MSRKISKTTASITVEAALVLPIFLFAALSLLYINTLLLYEEEVRWALERTGREVAVEYAVVKKKEILNPVFFQVRMNQYVSGDLNVSMLRSQFDEETQEICLAAEYSINAPFPMISGKVFSFDSRMRTRAFTGVESRAEKDTDGSEIVYVTRTGQVYHSSLSCTYLKLSISQVKYGDLEHLRNESGGKYYPCEGCLGKGNLDRLTPVFICNYGDRFHSMRGCKKISRSIREITLPQAGNLLPCSKCGGKGGEND